MSIRITNPTAVALLLLTAVTLSGCAAATFPPAPVGEPTASSESVELPSETGEPEPAPTPTLHPARQARLDAAANAGITAEQYEYGKQVIGSALGDNTLGRALTQVRNENGTPVVVIAFVPCPEGGNMRWGIAGSLSERNVGTCGEGAQASLDAAYAEMIARAEARGWTLSDYTFYLFE